MRTLLSNQFKRSYNFNAYTELNSTVLRQIGIAISVLLITAGTITSFVYQELFVEILVFVVAIIVAIILFYTLLLIQDKRRLEVIEITDYGISINKKKFNLIVFIFTIFMKTSSKKQSLRDLYSDDDFRTYKFSEIKNVRNIATISMPFILLFGVQVEYHKIGSIILTVPNGENKYEEVSIENILYKELKVIREVLKNLG